MTIGGQVYGLGHLDSFQFEFVVPEKDGRPSQSYSIDVWFSMHCFSRGIADGENIDAAQICSDGLEKRIFDRERHKLSKRLAEIIRNNRQPKMLPYRQGEFLDDRISSREWEKRRIFDFLQSHARARF